MNIKKLVSNSDNFMQIILTVFAVFILFLLLYFATHRNNLIETLNKISVRDTENTIYLLGEVVGVGKEDYLNNFFTEIPITVRLDDNQEIITNVGSHSKNFFSDDEIIIKPGQTVVLLQIDTGNELAYHLVDIYRLDTAIYLLLGFVLLAVLFSGKKGFASFMGLVVTLIILVGYIVPQILNGGNPILISLTGSVGIALISIYMAHGLNTRTTIALLGTLASIIFSVIFSIVAVQITSLNGTGSEESLFVAGLLGDINLKGLLLGGIIIGTLGILDDITTSQAAIIEELKLTDESLKFKDLFTKALSVGKEHIASLINTIVLAYAGASFPLFILIVANLTQPLWITLNGEFLVEELVRTIVGSSTLIIAVPITSLIASLYYGKMNKKEIRILLNERV